MTDGEKKMVEAIRSHKLIDPDTDSGHLPPPLSHLLKKKDKPRCMRR